MRATRSNLSVVATVLVLTVLRASADGPYVSVNGSATWQNNVTNAGTGDGILGAFDLKSGSDLTWLKPVDFYTILSSSLSVNADACTTFGGLNNVCVGTRLGLNHKFGTGPYATTVSIGLEANANGFQDSERSNVDGSVVAGIRQRFTDALQVVVEGRVCGYDARDVVFTGKYVRFDGTLNWDLNETWRAKLMGGWRNGDLVSNYSAYLGPYGWRPNDPGAYYIGGPYRLVSTFGQRFIAYRLRMHTGYFGGGISPAIGRHTALEFQYLRFESSGLASYVNSLVSASVVHHF